MLRLVVVWVPLYRSPCWRQTMENGQSRCCTISGTWSLPWLKLYEYASDEVCILFDSSAPRVVWCSMWWFKTQLFVECLCYLFCLSQELTLTAHNACFEPLSVMARLSCCVAGNCVLSAKESDIQETLELISERLGLPEPDHALNRSAVVIQIHYYKAAIWHR